MSRRFILFGLGIAFTEASVIGLGIRHRAPRKSNRLWGRPDSRKFEGSAGTCLFEPVARTCRTIAGYPIDVLNHHVHYIEECAWLSGEDVLKSRR